MKLIIGLGNPEKKYHGTRHNIGFTMLDAIKDAWQKEASFSPWSVNKKFLSELSEGRINNEKVLLVKPQTFMNLSGNAVGSLAEFYKVAPEQIIVIQDELDLAFGTFKLQTDKSSAGHRGVQSIIDRLGSQKFWRLRIGIAKDDKNQQGASADFVLNRFSLLEKMKLRSLKNTWLEEIKKLL